MTIPLVALPAGSVFGRVTDSQTGAPLDHGSGRRDAREDSKRSEHGSLQPGVARRLVEPPLHRRGTPHRTPCHQRRRRRRPGARCRPPPARGFCLWMVDGTMKARSRSSTDALDALDYPFTLWPITSPVVTPVWPESRRSSRRSRNTTWSIRVGAVRLARSGRCQRRSERLSVGWRALACERPRRCLSGRWRAGL